MTINRELLDAVYWTDFGAFTYEAFEALNPGQRLIPNWHIDAICYHVQQMVTGDARKRLILNLPPRTLKSFIASVALPAWLLGRNPSTRIICASYADELSTKFSRDCRALLKTPFYKRLFPGTKLNPKKASEGEFETTKRGYRLATSVGGTLTGRGGGVLIVDDPIKANDAESEVARKAASEWFRNTALSRLDDPAESLVCVAMQRLHVDDLAGIMIEQGWPKLVLPAIAIEAADYVIGEEEVYHRPAGQLLQPERDSPAAIDELRREIGSRVFAAQYQQNPTPPEGNMIKAAWLGRYDRVPERDTFQRVVLSCDPAGKAAAHNDYTRDHDCRRPEAGPPSSPCHPRTLGSDPDARANYRARRAMAGGSRHRRGYQQRDGADSAVEGGDPGQCRRPQAGCRQTNPHEPSTGPLRSGSHPAPERSPLACRFRERAP